MHNLVAVRLVKILGGQPLAKKSVPGDGAQPDPQKTA